MRGSSPQAQGVLLLTCSVIWVILLLESTCILAYSLIIRNVKITFWELFKNVFSSRKVIIVFFPKAPQTDYPKDPNWYSSCFSSTRITRASPHPVLQKETLKTCSSSCSPNWFPETILLFATQTVPQTVPQKAPRNDTQTGSPKRFTKRYFFSLPKTLIILHPKRQRNDTTKSPQNSYFF